MTRRARTVALVPLRAPGAGKTRLAGALDTGQRAALATAMLADVVDALREAAVDDIIVAAADALAEASAAAVGVRALRDGPRARDLNHALREATGRIGDVDGVLVVAADLPRLRASDVDAVLDADVEVVVAPTNAGGTGGLLRRPGGRIPVAYGPGSATRHRQLALAAGASVVSIERAGFHHDIDTWTDLAALHEVELGRATAAVLPSLLGRTARAG